MFKEVDSSPDFVALEHKILKMWEENNTFNELVEKNRGNERYFFLDGPITANNPMGVHHAWGRTYKDVFQRHRAMHGYDQRYQNGFDCQGLWVEVEVEKELSLNSKREIREFGLDKFARACRERVNKYAGIQTQQSKRLGQWMDWDNSYYTMTDNNIEHIWHFLKKCQEKGLLYQGNTVMPWCMRCGTSLSQHELADSYKDMVHPSVFIRLPLKERKDEYFLVWTTTPWTLPANTALAVSPDLTYLLVEEEDGRRSWIAEEARERLQGNYQEVKKVKGEELLNIPYNGPFQELEVQEGVDHRVIAWSDVSGEEGTGIVHIAPGCGAEDYELSQEYDLSVIAPIDEDGNYRSGFGFLSNKNVAQVEEDILKSLQEKGYLYHTDDYEHRYPVCWRCSEDLVFRLEREWFINCEPLREPMLKNSNQVSWQPSYAGKLMADWLNNMGDWCISRKRFWGLPLPFYPCSCGQVTIIGSRKELEERAVDGDFYLPELHRPWIDNIKVKCPECGEAVERISEVGDCWLDAGIVPFSTLGYLNGSEGYEYWKKWFPADFVVEMREQIRLWFYSLLFMSTVLENTAPYEYVMTYEKVHDETGRPMHKSWGNAIWFDEAVEKMGADIMRYIYTSQNPNVNLNFGYKVGDEVKRKLLTLWNVYSFFTTYARLDSWQPEGSSQQISLQKDGNILDRWMVARVQVAIGEVDKALFAYNPVKAVASVDELIEDTSRWYVRRNRRRFWKGEGDEDKNQAYSVLYYTLVTVTKLLAPILPFLAEDIYQNLVRTVLPDEPASVHLCDFPTFKREYLDKDLTARMAAVKEVCSLGHSARNQAGIKVRQPLQILEVAADESVSNWLMEGQEIIKDELNVKEIKTTTGSTDFFQYRIKPDFSVLGSKYGAKIPAIQKALSSLDPLQAINDLEQEGQIILNLDSEQIALQKDEVQIQKDPRPGFAVAEDRGMVVALNTEITPKLLREGIARDVLRHIQTLRKDGGLEVDTRINLACKAQGVIKESLEEHGEYIKKEALADTFQFKDELNEPITRELKLAHGSVAIGIEKR